MKLKKVISMVLVMSMFGSTPVLATVTEPEHNSTTSLTEAETERLNTLIEQVSDYTGSTTKVYSDTWYEPGWNWNWREGMVTGNGNNGVITSGAPYSDTMIYQNMYFILPTNSQREPLPTINQAALEETRQRVFNNDASWNLWGQVRDCVYSYHPGPQLRMTIDAKVTSDYQRWTDYETAEVGVTYTDEDGTWERKTFTSRKDDVTITEIKESSDGEKVNMTVSFDNPSSMNKFGWGYDGGVSSYKWGEEVNLQYKKLVDEDLEYITQVAHYPEHKNDLDLQQGGYASVTQVVVIGGEKEKVSLGGSKDTQNVGEEANPGIKITDADAVYLITSSDRTKNMGDIDDFARAASYNLVDELSKKNKSVINKYQTNGAFDYKKALAPHVELHSAQFGTVKFSLNASDSDRNLSNDVLLQKQKGSAELNDALVERAYNAGRYAEVCCAGYAAPRLSGMWTGEWNPGWRSAYTMNANVNLQVAAMNTGNITDGVVGYINFVLRQSEDWRKNAAASYGMHDAIQVPTNSDGDHAVLIETDAVHPGQYWNAGSSWMLLPIYEYWQCYGNQQFSISDKVDLYSIRKVLGVEDGGLTEAEVDKLIERGYLDLEQDILLPLLTKQANFWEQLCTPEYYVDAAGNRRYEKGKTELNPGETYLLIPTFSPENHPLGYTNNMTLNATMDIAAARDGLKMTIDLENAVNRPEKEEAIERWQSLMDKLPVYQYDGEPGVLTETGGNGALREWATLDYLENNNHRHSSHLYVAWPAYETQYDENLAAAAKASLENRDRLNTGDNTTGHGWTHHALISARLKDDTDVYNSLSHLLSSDIYYTSMMTDHNTNRGSDTYCTDTSMAIVAVINEALVFSNTGEIEILPALPDEWENGSISGLMARTQAEIENLSWDMEKGIADVQIRSDKNQTITLKFGQTWADADVVSNTDAEVIKGKEIKLSVAAGEVVNVRFFKEEVTKDALKECIDSAGEALDAKQSDKFPLADEAVNKQLEEALEAAQAVYNNPQATDKEVRDALWNLMETLNIFEDAYDFSFEVDLPRGIYSGKQTVTVRHEMNDRVELRYTTDGTEPTKHSKLYSGPIKLPLGITHLKVAQFIVATGEKFGETLAVSYQCNDTYNCAQGNAVSTPDLSYPVHGPELAVDGNANSRWAAQDVSDTDRTYTLEIDFGEAETFDTVVIDEYLETIKYKEDHRIESFEIQYLEASTGEWKTVHTFNQNKLTNSDIVLRPELDVTTGHAYYGVEFDKVTASKIRIIMQATLEVSIWEVSVHNNYAMSEFDNIALNKPTEAYYGNTIGSSSDGHIPEHATDGKTDTRWAALNNQFPHTLTVDLEDEYYIEDIYTLFELSSVFKFKIEYSKDNKNWETYVDATDNNQYITENFTEKGVMARYVRITITGSSDGRWASLWEFQIFGSKIRSWEDAEITGYVNEDITLPGKIAVEFEQGITKEFSVEWEQDVLNYDKKGTYEVAGRINELELPVAVTVTVDELNLVASYDMSAKNGKLIDGSGYGNDAAYVGFVDSDFAAEGEDTVLTFDGTDKYVKLPAGLINTEVFIIEATFKTSISANSWLWCLGTREDTFPNVTNYVFVSPKFGDGTIRAGIKDTSTEYLFANTGSILSDTYTTVRVKFDCGDMTLYVDGKEVSTMETPYSIQEILNDGTADDICGYIGKSLYIADTPFVGTLTQFDVYAIAEEEPVKSLPYLDVAEGTWYYEAVYDNYFANLMTGKSETIFAPKEALTRAQFALILYRIEGEPEITSNKKFDDVSAGSWYTDAVLWAYEQGIITGYSNTNNFGPHDNIMREQMAVMMYRYAKTKDPNVTADADLGKFADVNRLGDYATEAMKWAVGNGIITGKDKVTLDPRGNTIRAEAAVVIDRFMDAYL